MTPPAEPPSPLWWIVRLTATGLLIVGFWMSAHNDYRRAYHALLAVFIIYGLVGTPPPLWPRSSTPDNAPPCPVCGYDDGHHPECGDWLAQNALLATSVAGRR